MTYVEEFQLSSPVAISQPFFENSRQHKDALKSEVQRLLAQTEQTQFWWSQAQTISHTIRPILYMLGYEGWVQENWLERGNRHADLRLGSPFRTIGLVEAKPLDTKLTVRERKDYYSPLDQGIQYLLESDVDFCIITDAIRWIVIRRMLNIPLIGYVFRLDIEATEYEDNLANFLGLCCFRTLTGPCGARDQIFSSRIRVHHQDYIELYTDVLICNQAKGALDGPRQKAIGVDPFRPYIGVR